MNSVPLVCAWKANHGLELAIIINGIYHGSVGRRKRRTEYVYKTTSPRWIRKGRRNSERRFDSNEFRVRITGRASPDGRLWTLENELSCSPVKVTSWKRKRVVGSWWLLGLERQSIAGGWLSLLFSLRWLREENNWLLISAKADAPLTVAPFSGKQSRQQSALSRGEKGKWEVQRDGPSFVTVDFYKEQTGIRRFSFPVTNYSVSKGRFLNFFLQSARLEVVD